MAQGGRWSVRGLGSRNWVKGGREARLDVDAEAHIRHALIRSRPAAKGGCLARRAEGGRVAPPCACRYRLLERALTMPFEP